MMRLFLAFISLFPSALFAVDFEREIRPLLKKYCVECHGEKKQSSELRLDAKILPSKAVTTDRRLSRASPAIRLFINALVVRTRTIECRQKETD